MTIAQQSALPARRRIPDATAREVRTGVWVLVVLTAGAYLPSPLYPGYQRAFEFGDLAMTLLYAIFALVSAPALLLFGPAADALGPRAVLRLAVPAAAAGSACFALAGGAGWLALGRVAHGLALGAATGAAGALISRNRPGRGGVLAGAAFLAGTAAGPIAGGVLARFGTAVPYLLHLALLVIVWRRVSGLVAPGARLRRWRPTRPRIPAGLRLVFAAAAAAGFLAWAVVGLFLSIIPSLLGRAGQPDPAITGCVLGAVLICSLLVQPLVGRLEPHRAQLAGLAALLVSLVLLATTAGRSVLVALPAAVAAGAGHGLAYGAASAAVLGAAPEAQRGGISAALHLAFYLGSGCPAIAVGLAALRYPLGAATSGMAVVAALCVPVAAAVVLAAGRVRSASAAA